MTFVPGQVLTAAQLNALESGVASASAFAASGAGAVQRSASAKMRDVVSVKDFGAAGNASNDDTAAIQAAVDSFATDNGGEVFFPVGRYRLGSTVVINRPNVRLVGAGIYSTAIQATSHTFTMFRVASVGQVEFADFQMQAFGNTATQAWGIDAGTAYRVNLRSIQAIGLHSFCTQSGAEFRAIDCRVYHLRAGAGIGIRIDGADELREITGCCFQNAAGQDASAGILVARGSGVQVSHCQIMKMGAPVRVAPTGGNVVFSVKLLGVWCDTSSGNGVFLDGTAGAIHRVAISSGWMSSCARGVFVQGVASGLAITDCEVFGNLAAGISVLTGASVPGMLVANNRIAGNGAAGVSIGANVSGFSIVGNAVGPAADFGANALQGVVVAAGTSNDYLIASNRLRGNTGLALSDGGTGANKLVTGNLI